MKENGALHCETDRTPFAGGAWGSSRLCQRGQRDGILFLCLVGGQVGATLPEVQERVCVLG